MNIHRTLSRALILLLLLSSLTVFGQAARPPEPCRAQPRLVGKCFNARGRLSLYNGAPTIRLWRAGTRRVLGVSGSYATEGYSSIPAELERQLTWETDVWGDYTVCPFTRRRPGEMQLMCIDGARILTVKKRRSDE